MGEGFPASSIVRCWLVSSRARHPRSEHESTPPLSYLGSPYYLACYARPDPTQLCTQPYYHHPSFTPFRIPEPPPNLVFFVFIFVHIQPIRKIS